jgi:hypothetical protein
MSRSETGRQKKRKRKWPYAVTILILLLLAAVVFVLKTQKERQGDGDDGTTLETAFIGSIAVTTEGSGSVEAASTRAIALEYDGKL